MKEILILCVIVLIVFGVYFGIRLSYIAKHKNEVNSVKTKWYHVVESVLFFLWFALLLYTILSILLYLR